MSIEQGIADGAAGTGPTWELLQQQDSARQFTMRETPIKLTK